MSKATGAAAAAAAASSSSSSSSRPTAKPQSTIVIAGHVDCGKATLIGHLMYLLGAVDKRTVEKLRAEAASRGRISYHWAWVLGQWNKAERERGITMGLHQTVLETQRSVLRVNLPSSHRDFMKHFFRGASQSNILLLVCAAGEGEFEAGYSKDGMTRDHAIIAYTLGIKRAVVVVNKMDDKSVNYSEERYEEIKKEMAQCLKKVGFDTRNVAVVPISAFSGENVVEKSDKMPWYNGPTLVDALDAVSSVAAAEYSALHLENKPARLLVSESFKIIGTGAIVTGMVEQGSFDAGDRISVSPALSRASSVATLRCIEEWHNVVPRALPGHLVGFHLAGVSDKEIKPGMVLGKTGIDAPVAAVSFTAQIIVLGHPNKLCAGYCPVFQVGTAQAPVTFKKLLQKLDRRTGKVLEENPLWIKCGDAALVEMEPKLPLVVEPFLENPSLGRFCIRDIRLVVAVGVVKTVVKSPEHKWWGRRCSLLIRLKSRNRFGEAFSVWNVMTTVGLFLA